MSAAEWAAPSAKLLTVRRVQLAVGTVLVVIAAGVSGTLASGPLLGGALTLGAVLLAILGEHFLRRRVRAWGYAERDDDLLIRRGVLIEPVAERLEGGWLGGLG